MSLPQAVGYLPIENSQRIPWESLKVFCVRAFQKLGVSEKDAEITSDVLIASDMRGIASHGVAHLRRYVNNLRTGLTIAQPNEQIIAETPSTASIDAGQGLGPPVSHRAMQKAIEKASSVGAGFVSVRNSNHFGIAGYYAMKALEHDCIGMAMTNASALVVPTFGSKGMLGTNPIAVAAPGGRSGPFVLDMATSTVALGKLEIADQVNKSIPSGWAVDARGEPMNDPTRAMELFRAREGGGLLPLGGAGDEMGGYKGFGLALWVDIFSGVLSGAAFANLTYPRNAKDEIIRANIGHFFGAWRIDAFRPADEFKAAMDELQQVIRSAPKASGQDRIYIPGEKERAINETNRRLGIPLNARVVAELRSIAEELEIDSAF